MAAPSLPDEAQRHLDNVARRFELCIHTQDYDTALSLVQDLYSKMLDWQRQHNKRFHKGYPLHNIGYTSYLLNRPDALKYFTLAYIEDLLSADTEDEADATPAGRTLLGAYKMSRESLASLKQTVSHLKTAGSIPDEPAKVIEELGETQDRYVGLLGQKAKHLEQKRASRNFMQFDSPWDKRVFVGGSAVLGPIIEEMRKVITSLGFDPVIPVDFDMPPGMTIYHKCLALLHACKYAVFDVSEQAGQMLEMDRAPEYAVQTIAVWSRNSEFRITEMLKSRLYDRGIPCKPYDTFDEMKTVLGEFFQRRREP